MGGAVVASNTPRVSMLEGRSDLGVLWDIRVRPEARASGIGSLLFRAVEAWARDGSCRTLVAAHIDPRSAWAKEVLPAVLPHHRRPGRR